MTDMTPEKAQALLDAGPNQLLRLKDHMDLARAYIAQAKQIEAADKLAYAVNAQWTHDGEPTNADIARVLDALSAYEESKK